MSKHRRVLLPEVAKTCVSAHRMNEFFGVLRRAASKAKPQNRAAAIAACCTVCVFRQKFTLEDAIGSHACSLEALTRV
jgi:hypothetical protein